jgi:Universal stress protein UspA and related nucleotide-binding proteins
MAYSIVVGYDGSEQSSKALDAAIDWAKTVPDGEIIIACAQDRSGPAVGFGGRPFGVTAVLTEMWDELEKKIEGELAEAATRVKSAGVRVATACTPDRPDVTIINVARDTSARLIVVGAKGAHAREGQRTALGSTTNKVLHEAGGIPVLVV